MRANLVCFWPFSILNITKRTNRRPVIFIKENMCLLTNEMNEKLEWANQEFYLNFVIKTVAMATLDLFACFILFLKLILFLFRVTYNCQNVCTDIYDLILSLNNN